MRDLDRGDHLAHRPALQGEEAPLRYDTGELAAVADEEVPNAVTRHHERRLVQRRARREADRVPCHVRADRPLERELAGRGMADEVALGKDASRRVLGIDHHNGADPLGVHALERRLQRRLGVASHRCAPHRRGERLQQRTVADDLRGVGRPQRLTLLLEQAIDLTRAEPLERRARAEQGLDVGGVQLVAEEVVDRLVAPRRRTRAEDGVDRKQLTGPEREPGPARGRVGCMRPNAAPLDDEQRARRSALRPDDGGAFRVVAELHPARDERE